MIKQGTWGDLIELIGLGPNIRFTLNWGRHADRRYWEAVVWTEKGRILARSSSPDVDEVIRNVIEPARAEAKKRGIGGK